jgi:hypothetical protein
LEEPANRLNKHAYIHTYLKPEERIKAETQSRLGSRGEQSVESGTVADKRVNGWRNMIT